MRLHRKEFSRIMSVVEEIFFVGSQLFCGELRGILHMRTLRFPSRHIACHCRVLRNQLLGHSRLRLFVGIQFFFLRFLFYFASVELQRILKFFLDKVAYIAVNLRFFSSIDFTH